MSVPIVPIDFSEVPALEQLKKEFVEAYGADESRSIFISRSPGRVNLIGEHIDYCQFSVLPMAIENDLKLAFRLSDASENPSITLTNYDSNFAKRKFDLPLDGSLIEIDPSVSDWSNYFKCGLLVAQEFLKKKYKFEGPIKGMEIYVKGNIPTGGGLSSSAAFICAVSLAVIYSNIPEGTPIVKDELTKITAVAEHHVGVNNGGMDQAASICGKDGHALYVEFKPQLKATPFKFPDGLPISFLIANTLVVSNKAETGPVNYNLRVVEVTVAANVLAQKYGVTLETEGNLGKGTLRNFMDAYYMKYDPSSHKPWDGDIETGVERLTKMIELVDETLDQNGYTLDQAVELCGCESISQFTDLYLTNFPVRFQKLKLFQRAKHVYTEALRVLKALIMFQKGESNFFEEFGKLMNESQQSCDKLYQCSCPETDLICDIALKNGSFGSRLTGAGWGGCTVHLCSTDTVESVKNALIKNYYNVKYPNLTPEQLSEAIIVSKPRVGSVLYKEKS
ncbi:galactokinase [Kluyveromyces marxianus]|nr:galactokinase [Kluyveromyces marxianus]KAG0681517.1 galactokinase [Kluyveromyces marxianus]